MPVDTAHPSDAHFSVKDLAARGWSTTLIKKFLIAPDALRANPFYWSAAPMKYYLRARVFVAEASQDFLTLKEKAQVRSQAATARTAKAASALEVQVRAAARLTSMDYDTLRRKALQHKADRDQDRAAERGQLYEYSDPRQASEDHIQRWMVNYARHQLSNYDQVRTRYAGRVGVHLAAEAARAAILTKIVAQWPALAQAAAAARRDEDHF